MLLTGNCLQVDVRQVMGDHVDERGIVVELAGQGIGDHVVQTGNVRELCAIFRDNHELIELSIRDRVAPLKKGTG